MKEKPARECIEDDCHIDISHKGNRAKRCDEHQLAFHASRERDRYSRVKDTVSTRRILRRQGAAEYEGPREELIVDYSQGGFELPGMAPPVQWRQPAHLDRVTKVAMDHARQIQEAEPDQSSWEGLMGRRAAAPPTVAFPSPR